MIRVVIPWVEPVVNSDEQRRFHPDSLLEAGRTGVLLWPPLSIRQGTEGAGASLCSCADLGAGYLLESLSSFETYLGLAPPLM